MLLYCVRVQYCLLDMTYLKYGNVLDTTLTPVRLRSMGQGLAGWVGRPVCQRDAERSVYTDRAKPTVLSFKCGGTKRSAEIGTSGMIGCRVIFSWAQGLSLAVYVLQPDIRLTSTRMSGGMGSADARREPWAQRATGVPNSDEAMQSPRARGTPAALPFTLSHRTPAALPRAKWPVSKESGLYGTGPAHTWKPCGKQLSMGTLHAGACGAKVSVLYVMVQVRLTLN